MDRFQRWVIGLLVVLVALAIGWTFASPYGQAFLSGVVQGVSGTR